MNSPHAGSERPSEAGMWDVLCDGRDGDLHTAADREAVERALALAPEARFGARENQGFVERAVRYAAAHGVRQFITIGSGHPASNPVHEIASAVISDPHVVYVDYDPRVAELGTPRLTGYDNVVIVTGDMRHPWEIIDHPDVNRTIDWTDPVALLMTFVLHFLPPAEHPEEIISIFREHMAPGSYLVISHVSGGENPDVAEEAVRPWDRTRSRVVLRTPTEIEQLFPGFEMVGGGIVTTTEWGTNEPAPTNQILGLAGVARVP